MLWNETAIMVGIMAGASSCAAAITMGTTEGIISLEAASATVVFMEGGFHGGGGLHGGGGFHGGGGGSHGGGGGRR